VKAAQTRREKARWDLPVGFFMARNSFLIPEIARNSAALQQVDAIVNPGAD
jgi:hypothetical protein